MYTKTTEASGKRIIGDISLFDSTKEEDWESMYERIMEKKYAKETRNFSKKITGKKCDGEVPIYVVPLERGGPSYKTVELEGCNSEDVFYARISKGFGMQDVSSFTIGPIVGEGLCLVNAAFSKSICVMHIEGGGKVNLKRKNYWQRKKKPEREIVLINEEEMKVNGHTVKIVEWLKENEGIWMEEWNRWRKYIALSSRGSFHWADASETIAYRYKNKYINFVEWKKECYIRPSYDLLPKTKPFQFLEKVWKEEKVALGLVHPKGRDGKKQNAITKEYVRNLYDSKWDMCCQPYVVAGKLLDVKI